MDANDVCMTRGLKRLMSAPAERGSRLAAHSLGSGTAGYVLRDADCGSVETPLSHYMRDPGTLALMGRQRLLGIVQRCFKRIQELERVKRKPDHA